MSNNLTVIVASLGVLGVIVFAFRSKLSGFISGLRKGHTDKQKDLENEVEEQKKNIKKQEKKIKDLKEESDKAKKTINDISKSGNEEAKKIIEENDADKLINEFNEW